MKQKGKILYEEIANVLRQRIFEGTYEPGSMVATEDEICKIFGVSRITAKRALNNLAAEGLIRRVRSKGSFVNYPVKTKPEPVLARHGGYIALVTRSVGESSVRVLSGVDRVIREAGYRTMFHPLGSVEKGPALEQEQAVIEELLADHISGLILWPADSRGSSPVLEKVREAGLPTVLVDRTVEGCTSPCVMSDNISGAHAAVKHLIEEGHTRIAFFGQTDSWNPALTERLNGYYHALVEAGLTIHPELIWVPEMFRRQIASLPARPNWIDWFQRSVVLDNPDRATALFALWDYPAMDATVVASRMGLQIPDDLAVVGFDNSAVAKGLIVPLTSVEQEWEQIGAEAAQLLARMMGGAGINEQVFRIPTRLIIRASSSRYIAADHLADINLA